MEAMNVWRGKEYYVTNLNFPRRRKVGVMSVNAAQKKSEERAPSPGCAGQTLPVYNAAQLTQRNDPP